MKKIAIIIERTDIHLGGAERSIYELTQALSALGHHVDLLVAKGKTDSSSIHILCPGSKKRTSRRAFETALKNHLSENHYDIVHSVLPFGFADVYQPRGGSYKEAALRNAASYENLILQRYKKITSFANFRRTSLLLAEKKICTASRGPVVAALSKYVADQFKKHYSLDDQRIKVIPNGIKISQTSDSTQADRIRGQILSKLRLKEADNPALFLFVANNFRLKGLVPLIKAFHLAGQNQTAQNSALVIIGNDSTKKYRHLAKKLEIENRVVFLGHVRKIQNALEVSDCLVLPTFYDPASRVVLEALAAEVPVITTSFNGAADLFHHDRHGKVIDKPDNIPSLADAICHFSQKQNCSIASQYIRTDNLKGNISIDRAAAQLDSLYDSIILNRSQK